MKRYSVIGLSLLAVSAIVSAFLPANASNDTKRIQGNLQPSDNPSGEQDVTCTVGTGDSCSYTVTKVTAAGPGSGTTAINGATTLGNTLSLTTIGA